MCCIASSFCSAGVFVLHLYILLHIVILLIAQFGVSFPLDLGTAIVRFDFSMRDVNLLEKGGVHGGRTASGWRRSSLTGESPSIILSPVLSDRSSLLADSGSSPLSTITEVFGDDLKAPEQSLRPWVWIVSRARSTGVVAEAYIGQQ